jgi:AraC-like DNA-binding protein
MAALPAYLFSPAYFQERMLETKELYFSNEWIYERIQAAKLFMDENYHNPIGINILAGQALFSPYHFIRLFKSTYGKTPYQYLLELRMGKARDFLKKGHAVTDVCWQVGFSSSTSFSGQFKKTTGLTPSAFQKKIIQPLVPVLPFRWELAGAKPPASENSQF